MPIGILGSTDDTDQHFSRSGGYPERAKGCSVRKVHETIRTSRCVPGRLPRILGLEWQ
jgi:hypothetical protein